MQQNALYMIDKIFLFSPKRLFLPLFWRSNRAIIHFGLIWFRHFFWFYRCIPHVWLTCMIIIIFEVPGPTGSDSHWKYLPAYVKIFGWLIGLRASTDKLDMTTDLTLIGSICMSDAHPLFDNSYLIIFRRTQLLFASNNCKSGEAGRVVSGSSLEGAYNSWWQCHRGVKPDGFVRLRNQNQTPLTISAFYFCYFSSFPIPICCYFIFPQKRKSVL